jgi:glutamate N-acetyltransferase/amino-acid N-acetyltransferase
MHYNDAVEFIEDGCVTTPAGFAAGGIHAGFRRDPARLDFAFVEADGPCCAAGVFTRNVFCSAPVIVSRDRLAGCGYGTARVIAINSGNANAATGPIGLDNARKSAGIVAEAVGCAEDDVLLASTGIIGIHLDMQPFRQAAPSLHARVSADFQGGHDAASAIMTTDTHPKECAAAYTSTAPGLEGCSFSIGGMVKGSGMIMPNMATMIAVITTDAPLSGPAAHAALSSAVSASFNKVTVDSDTSTNDTCFLMASGKAAPSASIEPDSSAYEEFLDALTAVCVKLARMVAADGEGATRLVTVSVTGAADAADADAAARAIANSPLVKTAIYGHDANWGRIAAAAGKSGARFEQDAVDIDIMGMPVCRGGLTVPFDEEEALGRFEDPEIAIDVDLGAGSSCTTVWTCDFTHEYIAINGDYRS